jgi:MYXO-CTERM domain-containing protein
MLGLCLFSLSVMAFRPDPSVYIGVEPTRLRRFHAEQQTELRHAGPWLKFLDGPGQGWLARFDEASGAPFSAWGPPIALGPISDASSADRAVRRVFSTAPQLLGIDIDGLVLGRSGYIEATDSWLIQLDQVLPDSDITVYRRGVTLRIRASKLIAFGVDVVADSSHINQVPTINAKDSEVVAIKAGPAGNSIHTDVFSRLMALPAPQPSAEGVVLVWEVRSKTTHPVGHWVSFVDAHSGDLLNVHNEVRFMSGSIRAEHDVRTVDGDMMVSALPWMRIQRDDTATYTDDDGHWDVGGAGSAEGVLLGPYLRIHNEQGANAQFEDLEGDVLITDIDASQAELSSYVFQAQIREWGLQYAPEISFVSSRLDVHVNENEHCNAYFDGDLHFMRAGSGCNNSGRIADVNYHEWGHGFHYFSLVSGSFDGTMSEGIADVVSVLNTNDPTISPGFFSSGAGIREVSADRVYPNDWVGEVHTDGLIFAGAVWDLKEILAEDVGEDEAIDTTSSLLAAAIKSGPTTPESFDAFLFADDDNADLSDGTPNSCAIIAAFSRHGLGPGGAGGSIVTLEHSPIGVVVPNEEIVLKTSAINMAPECIDVVLEQAAVHYSLDQGGSWDVVAMGGDMAELTGAIPSQPSGTLVWYYFSLATDDGGVAHAPLGGPIAPFTLTVGHLVELYCEDFEDDDGGYVHALMAGESGEGADDWAWGRPTGMGGDPDFAFSGENVWGNDLGGGPFDGQYQNQKYNRLSSVPIDVGEHKSLVLQYRRWLSVEDGFYDQANILANSRRVWTNHGTNASLGSAHTQDDRWMLHSVAITADESGSLTINWEIVSDQGLTMGGWNVDDVCVFALDGDAPPSAEEPAVEEPESDAYVVAELPAVSEGEKLGCACTSGPTPRRFGWLGLMIVALISAARRACG